MYVCIHKKFKNVGYVMMVVSTVSYFVSTLIDTAESIELYFPFSFID